MVDVHTKSVRSYNMSRIKSKDTKPELIVRRFLFSEGFRYRLHDKRLPGKPDIYLPKFKTVIFIHGCFWHGHKGCKYFVIPKTRTIWWKNKISINKNNDKLNQKKLKNSNFKVITIWECKLRVNKLEKTFINLINKIKQ